MKFKSAILAGAIALAASSAHAAPTANDPAMTAINTAPLQQESGAPASPMQFYVAHNGGNCGSCTFIVAAGAITQDTPATFQRFIDGEQYASGMNVYLDSPGGSLIAGMELGRLFRKYRVNTTVGHSVRMSDPMGPPFSFAGGAECLSACIFAFAGGVHRAYDPVGQSGPAWAMNSGTRQALGAHQFFRSIEATLSESHGYDSGLSDAQAITGRLIEYLTAMGVDAGVIELASRAQPNQMWVLSQREALSLKLANDPPQPASWILHPLRGGMTLTSSGTIDHTAYTASITCDPTIRGGLAIRFSITTDMRYLEKQAPEGLTALLRRSFDGLNWGQPSRTQPVTILRKWPEQPALDLNWDGQSVQLMMSMPAGVVSLLASGSSAAVSLYFPNYILGALPTPEIIVPELAQSHDLLLRNCPRS